MSTAWMIYFWTRLDSIGFFLGAVVFVSGMVAFWLLMTSYLEDGLDGNKAKSLKYSIATAVCVGFLSIWVPSSKDVALIVGGQLATNTIQSPEAKEIGSKALLLINSEIDKRLNENADSTEDEQ